MWVFISSKRHIRCLAKQGAFKHGTLQSRCRYPHLPRWGPVAAPPEQPAIPFRQDLVPGQGQVARRRQGGNMEALLILMNSPSGLILCLIAGLLFVGALATHK